jgi:hypothetical protein
MSGRGEGQIVKYYRRLSNVAFVIAGCFLIVALVLLTGAYTRMQNTAVVMLVGFGFFATLGAFLASDQHVI